MCVMGKHESSCSISYLSIDFIDHVADNSKTKKTRVFFVVVVVVVVLFCLFFCCFFCFVFFFVFCFFFFVFFHSCL